MGLGVRVLGFLGVLEVLGVWASGLTTGAFRKLLL